VERSWAKGTDDPEFWNPKLRSPNCFNEAAARSISQIYLMKSRLVLAGQSRAQVAHAIAAALDERKLPALAPGAMCYMMSKQQYLNDQDKSFRPQPDVLCCRGCSAELGRESARLAADRGECQRSAACCYSGTAIVVRSCAVVGLNPVVQDMPPAEQIFIRLPWRLRQNIFHFAGPFDYCYNVETLLHEDCGYGDYKVIQPRVQSGHEPSKESCQEGPRLHHG
jgi:hypothetical protein